jgi:hypothetical protein
VTFHGTHPLLGLYFRQNITHYDTHLIPNQQVVKRNIGGPRMGRLSPSRPLTEPCKNRGQTPLAEPEAMISGRPRGGWGVDMVAGGTYDISGI